MNWLNQGKICRAPDGLGDIEARNIKVGSKIGGRIQGILVREGDQVRAGNRLAYVYNSKSGREGLHWTVSDEQSMS